MSAFAQTVGGQDELLFHWNGTSVDDRFGYAVSGAGDINGDGFDDMIVGAYGAHGGYGNGAAYAYSGVDGSLLYQWNGLGNGAKWFGYSVSDAGDINGDGFGDVIIGAPMTDPAGLSNAGSAFIFSGADGLLLYRWDGNNAGDQFGMSVSGAMDIDGDGVSDAIVGAPVSFPSGSVYVFSGATGSPLHQWDGININGGSFGLAVSHAGDVNGDSFADVVIGDPGSFTNAGSTFVYSGATGLLLYQWNGANHNDALGTSVSDAGDLNQDGYDDLLVGAPGASYGGMANAGSAFLFSGFDGSILMEWGGENSGDGLGYSLSGVDDFDGDGLGDVILGAHGASPGGLFRSGSVYVRSGLDGSLFFKWDGPVAHDFFGDCVSGVGDADGDGLGDVIIGSYGSDTNGTSSGATHVFSFNPFLNLDNATISAATGGILSLQLDFPSEAAFDRYKVLISESGIGPTTYGVEIPLSLDGMVLDTFFGIYPIPVFSNLHGLLDSDGNANASLTVPAGIPSALIGKTYYFAAIANQPGQLPEYSSAFRSIIITL